MSSFAGRADRLLVDLDAQAGRGEPLDVPGHEGQRGLVEAVVEHLGAKVVVDADALFLDEVVRRGETDLQAGRQGDRAERAVRGELHVVHLGERGDLAYLGDAAG